MANLSTKQTVHDQDILTLNQEEYDVLNKIYRQAMREKLLSSGYDNDDVARKAVESIVTRISIKYVVLTDGLYRAELVVERK